MTTSAVRIVTSLVIALGVAAPLTAQSKVAVFANPAFVDTTPGPLGEAYTIQQTLAALGHTVLPFTGYAAADWQAAIAGSDCLLIPELEIASLGPQLSDAAKTILSDHVLGGGGMIVMGGSFFVFQSASEFINALFGTSLTNSNFGTGGTSGLDVAAAAGTAWAGGPATIPNQPLTHSIFSGLPPDSRVIYRAQDVAARPTVVAMPFGSGQVVYLGWIWANAVPVGTLDDGWLSVLDAAVTECAIPSECYLVIGQAPGGAGFLGDGHLFDTQVGPVIENAFPVLMTDIPEFVLPIPPTGPWVSTSLQGAARGGSVSTVRGAAGAPPMGGTSAPWMQDGQFVVQVLMWNPQVFPGLPEQYTAGLFVSVLPDGSVLTAPYGASVGDLEIRHEIATNAQGETVIRFPFSIPGY